jgi:uncharacterized protein
MGTGTRRRLPAFVSTLLMAAAALPLGSPPAVAAASPDLVVSQVYGGGGNAGATYTHDYIEIFNRGVSAAPLNGMSLQYASAAGTGNFGSATNLITELPSVSVAAGKYLLVREASNAAVGDPIPAADVLDATPISMAAGAGKVALVTGTTSLGCNGGSTACSLEALGRIVDLVGYGTGTSGANFFEGAGAAPTISGITSDFRANGGCQDTDNNSADFTAATPSARNSATSPHNCSDNAPSVSVTSPIADANGVLVGSSISITFSEPVNTPNGWFTISCSVSGAHSASATGDGTTFTLDPDSDFGELETCTVTVLAALVTDQDATDPPDNMAADYTYSFTTEGDVCNQTYTHIYAIQGSGPSAAITGNVTTQGVVVGDFEGTAANSGFFLQDATGDDNASTSDGIFVFTGNSDLVSVGQVVRVTGFARERFNQTTINGSNSNTAAVTAGNIVQCGTASVSATDVNLPFATADAPERYEGMLVRLPQQLVIAEYFNYDRFGEIVLAKPLDGESRPFTGTAIDEPGAAAQTRNTANTLSRITLDDNQSTQNPPVLRHPNGQPFSLTNSFRGGDLVQNTVGVLAFDFSLYRIFPTDGAEYTAVNARPSVAPTTGGRLTVAAQNTLNFFLTLDTTASDSGPGPCGANRDLDCRGADADQPDEFKRQRDKLLATLAGLNADVIGLNEIENTPSVSPLGDPSRGIVAGLNSMPGVGTYSFIDTGVIGTDAIRVGMIYRPDVVTPVGAFQVLDSRDDARFIDTKSRPALAQTFEENATGARFTVVVNHLKSKGSACTDVGDPDLLDGQGNCSQTRRAAAEALVDWIATDPTGSGDPDFLIIGDLNSYAMEDTIDEIKAGSDDTAGTGDDFTNLIRQYQGVYAYSYVFDGMSGYLDHALASSTLTPQVTGAAEWHINADEPDILDYDTSFKPPEQDALYEPKAYRASDHDSVLVGLDLDAAPVITALSGPTSAVLVGSAQSFNATFTDVNAGESHTSKWSWGDGSPDTNHSSTGSDSATHAYSVAGFYTVTFTVTDDSGLSDSETLLVAVYDPAAGQVTGSGTYGVGTAFSLSARYRPSGTTLSGTTTFSAPGVSFASTSTSWLIVSGNRGTYSGSGTYNGTGGFTYLVSVLDGGVPGSKDRIRLQVSDSTGTVVYDTQPGASIDALPTTALTSGNVIVVH